jgi:hypothetical protein
MKGTNLQEVFDAFFIKVPQYDFSGKESQIIQFFKSAIVKCHRHTYDSLDYKYDPISQEGCFDNTVSNPSIELISMFMVKEFLSQKLALLNKRKQYLGTQAFNKIPSNKDEFDMLSDSLNYWKDEIARFLMEFPDYSEER